MTNFKMIAAAAALGLVSGPAFANSSTSVSASSSSSSSGSSSVSGSASAVYSNGKSFVSGSVSVSGNAKGSVSATAGNKSLSITKTSGTFATKPAPKLTYSVFDITTWEPVEFDFAAFKANLLGLFGR